MHGHLVLNPDELGADPVAGMDLAVALGIGRLEIRSAYGANALLLADEQLLHIRELADERELTVAALASPLWKWCRPEAATGQVDSFGFPTRVPASERTQWIDRALHVAQLLGTERVRIFSHLKVEHGPQDALLGDRLLTYALDQADRANVRLLLENEPVCTIATAHPLLEVLRRHDRLRLWLDLGNLHEVGQADAGTVAELAPYVDYVHIKDFIPGHEGWKDFVAAGAGHVPYSRLLPVLEQVRPGLPYALETHVRDDPAAALREGAAFLRTATSGTRT
ncbi:sugar phosphate isomerase/epimerase family protein [Streptomyces sp. NBC_01304]|uniref:sugar phosphate isomerase/epimerase family protein n=1 Tax=Streptomyces sp. NBC_01304 TaxID=2903818 RepID=UPI002E10FDEE|nr:sugar phosphate isomerase/epimerase [Streptomyces sp. NBC_01304]